MRDDHFSRDYQKYTNDKWDHLPQKIKATIFWLKTAWNVIKKAITLKNMFAAAGVVGGLTMIVVLPKASTITSRGNASSVETISQSGNNNNLNISINQEGPKAPSTQMKQYLSLEITTILIFL